MAALACEHLCEQGFRHLAFYETKGRACATRRKQFIKCAEHVDLSCHVRSSSGRRTQKQEQQAIISWLMNLPRPTGVMACCDRLGLELIEACRMAEIKVPSEVAIISVGNDELLCEMADPPLSSVFPDAERIGYLAASYLDTLLAGKGEVPQITRIPPIGVVARQSTDSFAIDDPDVAAAARFIRDHAKEGIKVADVLDAVPMSRRVLESRFRKWFGCTPHREILRVQLSHVRALIRDTDLSLERIAAQCGFRHVEYMSVVFKRELGLTPSEYRQVVS
jgi:LacI family transcriptional regulator